MIESKYKVWGVPDWCFGFSHGAQRNRGQEALVEGPVNESDADDAVTYHLMSARTPLSHVDFLGLWINDPQLNGAVPPDVGFGSLFPDPAKWIGGEAFREVLASVQMPEKVFLSRVSDCLDTIDNGSAFTLVCDEDDLEVYAAWNILRFKMEHGLYYDTEQEYNDDHPCRRAMMERFRSL